MFEKRKRGTQFVVTKDEYLLSAMITGGASTQALSGKDQAKIKKAQQNYKAFRTAVPDIESKTAYLIVRNPAIKLVGVIHCETGILRSDDDLAVMAAVRKQDNYSLFDTFWSEGLFWRKFINYAFRKRAFGGPMLDAVEEEQSKKKITTNRDGWINGNTWLDQQDTDYDQPAPSAFVGGHRGEAETPRALRGAVNFS